MCRTLLFLGLLLCVTAGCQPAHRRPATGQPYSTPYYPLAVGSEWVYQGPLETQTMRVAKHETVGTTPSALVQTFLNATLSSEQNVAVNDRGVFVVALGGKKLSQPLPLLPLPPTEGKTWSYRFTDLGVSTRHVHQLGRDHVRVPAGEFDCVTVQGDVYEGQRRQKSFIQWLAADVGMVKQRIKVGSQTLVYELVKYTPGK